MRRHIPPAVARLLRSDDCTTLDGAWSEFLDEYNRLILHGARSLGGSDDAVMDRYASVLEQLRQDDFRRLRAYAADGRGKFTTWLVTVVRRLCLDHERARYGRPRGGSPERDRRRRDLADLIGAEVDPDLLPSDTSNPEEDLLKQALHADLHAAIARLEPSERLLLRLRFEDEVPASEVASILSLPTVFHVYRRLNRIYEQLREALQDAGVSDARP